MKISDYKDEEALDLVADLIEPAGKIFSDQELRKAVKDGSSKPSVAKIIIKNHKSEIIEILARINNVPVNEYHFTVMSLITDVIDIIQDQELMSVFYSQGQKTEITSSGSVSENTEA